MIGWNLNLGQTDQDTIITIGMYLFIYFIDIFFYILNITLYT